MTMWLMEKELVDLVQQANNIIPIWEKLNLKIEEAAEYSNIGVSTLRGLLKEKGCPFLLMVGKKQLIKRKEFENYLKDKHYL